MSRCMYLVDLELRYTDKPRNGNDYADHVSKTITVGIFDTYEEAVQAGNAMLEAELESRFPLNKNYMKKNRFGENYTKYLISDLAYLTTPFSFFSHIKKLELGSVGAAIEEAVKAVNRYREWKKSERDLD
jgi:hypothetical protein